MKAMQVYVVEYYLDSHPRYPHYEEVEAFSPDDAIQAVKDTEGEDEVVDIKIHTVN